MGENKDFDLSAYELEETATLTVQSARGDGDMIGADGVNPVTIDLFGSGARQAVKAMHRAGQASAVRLAGLIRGKVDPKASEKADQEQVDKLVACTKAINNFPVDPEALYANPKLTYITKQVIRFLDDDANFAKAPSKT